MINPDNFDEDLRGFYYNHVQLGCRISQGEFLHRFSVLEMEQDRRDMARAVGNAYKKEQKDKIDAIFNVYNSKKKDDDPLFIPR
ncbi:hypothetical protein J4399_00170 [Candidatus Woesearchaeota archaeon]|nr:hypothetical protein [Candidatus Woesearchaeota archaeon]HIJ13269.1 hypothetical protein [Candidatus Woesearchaeota archaeon]